MATRFEYTPGETFRADLDTAERFNGVDAYGFLDPSYQAPTDTFDVVAYDAPYLGGNITGYGYFRAPYHHFFVPTSDEQFNTYEEAQAQGNADEFVGIDALRFTNGTLFIVNHLDAIAVKSLYESFLGRTADAEGFSFWFSGLKSGVVNLQQLTDEFVAAKATISGEPILTNQQFVAELYQDFFGREGDEAGLEFWSSNLNSNAADRGDVLAAFVEITVDITGQTVGFIETTGGVA